MTHPALNPVNPVTFKKPPVLTDDEIDAVRSDFIGEVERALIIQGERTPAMVQRLIAMRDEVVVTPRTGPTHDARWHGGAGRYRAEEAAQVLIDEAAERAHLMSFGPDPVPLLVARLVELGVPAEEAATRAARRIRRLDDGRVATFAANGSLFTAAPEPDSDRTYTEAELARFRDPKAALATAARLILEERERPVAPAVPRIDRQAEIAHSIRGAL